MGKLRHKELAQIQSVAGWRQLSDLTQMCGFHWHSKSRSGSGAFPPGTTEHRNTQPCRNSTRLRGVLQPCWGWGMKMGLGQESPTPAERVGLYENGKGQWEQLSSCWPSAAQFLDAGLQCDMDQKDRVERLRRKCSLKKCWRNQHGSV